MTDKTKTVTKTTTAKTVDPVAADLKAKREALKAMKATIKELAAKVKANRIAVKTAKANKAKERKAAAIAKAKAKLDKLTSPAGVVAKRVAKKPGPVTVSRGPVAKG